VDFIPPPPLLLSLSIHFSELGIGELDMEGDTRGGDETALVTKR
jgi:hypothetical protein